MMKICFVASSGGHWEELLCLKKIASDDSFFITEKGNQSDEFSSHKIYTVPQINRKEKKFIPKFFKLFSFANNVIKKENPKVIITTGALIAFPICLIGKIKGKKIIYIESFARVNNKSLTGRLVYPFADLFLVQWETMLKLYPKAKFIGGIF